MANYYHIIVPTDQPTIDAAITDILASGLAADDRGFIQVIDSSVYTGTGSYNIPAGELVIQADRRAYADEWHFLNSGNIVVSNIDLTTLNVSGAGVVSLVGVSGTSITMSGGGGLNIYSGFISTALVTVNTESLNIYNSYSSGNCKYTFTNLHRVNIYSGMYSNFDTTGTKMLFQLCSGVYLERMMAANTSGAFMTFEGCPDITINHVTAVSNVSGDAMAVFQTLGGINCSGHIEFSILMGNGGSGAGPIVLGDANQLITSSGSCLYNFIPNATYTGILGTYYNRDPLFVDPSGGDLRLDVNSFCASSADRLDFLESYSDVEIEKTLLNKEAIKFYLLNQGIRAVIPSGVYVVGSGLAIFFSADTALDNDMDVLINKQYVVHGSGTTFQSYSNQQGISGYMSDYRLIPYIDEATNETKYYVQPFTILSFDALMQSVPAVLQDIEVSGKFKYHGFTRDRFQTIDGIPLYWVGEEFNSYLYGYSLLSNKRIVTYPVFPYSGVVSSVQLPDLNYLSRTRGQANIYTDKVYVDDHYESRNITLSQTDGIFQFQSFEKDTSLRVAALGTLGDYLVVLAREQYKNNSQVISTTHHLHFYNKYEQEPFITPTVIVSGVAELNDVNVGDLTFNDVGQLLIGVSGYINFYQLFYDYALATRNPGIIKTTLLFREDYKQGVKV